MPTVVVVSPKIRIVTYHNDHLPMHVHVLVGAANIKVEIVRTGARYMSVKGPIAASEIRNAVVLVEKHRAACIKAWKRYHP